MTDKIVRIKGKDDEVFSSVHVGGSGLSLPLTFTYPGFMGSNVMSPRWYAESLVTFSYIRVSWTPVQPSVISTVQLQRNGVVVAAVTVATSSFPITIKQALSPTVVVSPGLTVLATGDYLTVNTLFMDGRDMTVELS